MAYLLKLVGDIRADALSWGEGVGHVGILLLEILELMHQHVELAVADLGRVEHVVVVVVAVELSAQVGDALSGGGHWFIFMWLSARSTLQRGALQKLRKSSRMAARASSTVASVESLTDSMKLYMA